MKVFIAIACLAFVAGAFGQGDEELPQSLTGSLLRTKSRFFGNFANGADRLVHNIRNAIPFNSLRLVGSTTAKPTPTAASDTTAASMTSTTTMSSVDCKKKSDIQKEVDKLKVELAAIVVSIGTETTGLRKKFIDADKVIKDLANPNQAAPPQLDALVIARNDLTMETAKELIVRQSIALQELEMQKYQSCP